MRKSFIMTSNVKKYVSAMNRVMSCAPGIDRFVLVSGEVGQGKTETAAWWRQSYGMGSVFVRVKKAMGPRWLLENIAGGLGLMPQKKSQRLFEQCVEALAGADAALILDEIDYVADKVTLVETIRDIGDVAGIAVVLVCMPWADERLRRYPALMRRVSQRVAFRNLGYEDAEEAMREICEVAVSEGALRSILGKRDGGLPVYMLYRWAQLCEAMAKKYGVDEVREEHLLKKGAKL